MKRINVLCEGPTEEIFVQKVLYPYFLAQNIFLTPRSLDGGFGYDRLRHEIIKWLKNDQGAYVTTMIDLYGLKGNYPQKGVKENDPLKRVNLMEAAIAQDILKDPKLQNKKFIPYLQLHEFEALLFSDPVKLENYLNLDRPIPKGVFTKIRSAFKTPEYINNSPQTAPSKRILGVCSAYNKVVDGVFISQDIGLQCIRAQCPHFDAWLLKLET